MDERRALEQVAEGYRREGYNVVVRPTGTVLPPFLARFEPDLIGRKNGEGVVVEVKRKDQLAEDAQLAHLAGIVNAEPGWRFDLVVLNEKTWPDEVSNQAVEPTGTEIRAMLDEASRLISLHMSRGAFVAAWAALEAAMRAAAGRLGIVLERNYPRFVLNTLYSEGVIPRSDYDKLQDSVQFGI